MVINRRILDCFIMSLHNNPNCTDNYFWNFVNVLKEAITACNFASDMYPSNEMHLEGGYFSMLQIETLLSPDSFIWDWKNENKRDSYDADLAIVPTDDGL